MAEEEIIVASGWLAKLAEKQSHALGQSHCKKRKKGKKDKVNLINGRQLMDHLPCLPHLPCFGVSSLGWRPPDPIQLLLYYRFGLGVLLFQSIG